jgi:HlyD family secretion protein
MDPRKPYPTDLNDYAWDLTTYLLPEAPPGGRPEKCSTQDILNGIFSIVHGWRGGCSRTISHLGRLSFMTSDSGSGTAPGSYQARLQRLTREVTQLEGQLTTTRIVIERLEYESERRYIRAPVAGRLGEVTTLRVGAMVGVGTRLGAVVPPGMLKIMADFLPPAALGRIQPGQPARLRLEGFPWTQYGAVSATVASVANEV